MQGPESMQYIDDDNYPPGDLGDLAICIERKGNARQMMERFSGEANIEREYEKAKKRDDVEWVILKSGPLKGKSSPVVWIARCEGGTFWHDVRATDGAIQEYDWVAPTAEFMRRWQGRTP
jgi:hypothetical protein